jgi:hypothetical protein
MWDLLPSISTRIHILIIAYYLALILLHNQFPKYQMVPSIAWGKHTRVVLDVGCGVASFGGYLFDKDVITMSFAPKDEHEAQVQFALERGIPAFSAVMGTQRLVFPSNAFDAVHCAYCRVSWHAEGILISMCCTTKVTQFMLCVDCEIQSCNVPEFLIYLHYCFWLVLHWQVVYCLWS